MAIKITENGVVRYVNENDVDRTMFPNLTGAMGDEQYDALNGRLTVVEGKVSDLEECCDDVNTDIGQIKNEFNQLEAKVEDAYVTETETGAIASFTDGADGVPVKDLSVAIEPVQSGSGDPSPENVRPISGWTGANVMRMGKNLYSRENGEYNVPVYTTDGTATAYPDVNVVWIKVKPNTTYNLSCLTPSQTFYIRWINCDKNKGFISRLGTQTNANLPTNVTTTSDTEWAQIACNQYDQNNLYKNDWELCVSETATAYEPYQGETYEVDWTTEAGTVYGGTLDVTTGGLTVDRGYIASYNGETLPSTWISDRDVYASGTTPTTGAQVVYTLTSTQTYQLTPEEVKTILGQNNIFADTGDVTVQYRADTKLYIDKVLNA